ncbi:MAG: CPBP family intramembrane metalloprotease [Winogradskyella sp.]|nr:MAG: CPBP family intramembrane metalloprotease [Winogradskyella sp.]
MQTCPKCDYALSNEVKYCTQCGVILKKPQVETRAKSLNLVIVFYVTFLLFSLISYLIYESSEPSLALELTIESVFALLVIGFSLSNYKSILKLYKLPIFDNKIVTFTLLFPVLSAFFVSISIGYLNEWLFEVYYDNYYSEYVYLSNPILWSFILIAILPPIFEELAFRGFLFNELSNVASQRVTIIATAFLFALVHFSLISFIWIFPFGLLLGYLRSKYNTMWYGIVIHFIHNFIVLMIDYYNYNSELVVY